MSTEKLLSQVGIFARLDQEQLAQLATCTETRQYQAGQVVVAENETTDALHIVVSGRLQVSKARPGREPLISSTLGPGQYCCETALIADAPRTASIVAAEPTTCLTLRQARFQQELEAQPRIAVALVFEVSRRLRDTLDLLDTNA
jgi:CRP-like cAMP-binding protein